MKINSTPSYRSVLSAMIILGSGSIIGSIVGVISAKSWALFVGPSGVGRSAILFSVASIFGTLSGVGLSTGVVKIGARLYSGQVANEFERLISDSWNIWRKAATIFTVLVIALSTYIPKWIGNGLGKNDILVILVAGIASSATALVNGTINAMHSIVALTWINILSSIIGLLLSVSVIYYYGNNGILLAVTLYFIGPLLVSVLAYKMLTKRSGRIAKIDNASRQLHNLQYGIELLSFGLPFAVSNLLGVGVQNIIPFLIMNDFGIELTGNYRAASTIGIGYIGVILIALSQDYFPRLSAAKDSISNVMNILTRQIKFSLLIIIPLVAVLCIFGEKIIYTCYSKEFYVATLLLPWYAIGAIPKVLSYNIGYAIMVRLPGWVFLITECLTGIVWLFSSYALMKSWGIIGAGASYVIAYTAYLIIVSAILLLEMRCFNKKIN